MLLTLFLLGACVGANMEKVPRPGKIVGEFQTFFHGVSGYLRIPGDSDNKLDLINFNYDGKGPATVFWAGVKGQHGLNVDETGILVPNENGETGPLKEYKHANITITLPNNIKTYDLQWLAVWCQIFKLDFGHFIFHDEGAAKNEEKLREPVEFKKLILL